MSGRGRTVRTPERAESIINNLRIGATRTAAAGHADLDIRTMERWMTADAAFRHAVLQAEADAELRHTANVIDDAFGRPAQYDEHGRMTKKERQPNPDSSRWWLERRRPHSWGQRVSIDVRGTVERVAAENGLDAEELLAEADRLIEENAARYRK